MNTRSQTTKALLQRITLLEQELAQVRTKLADRELLLDCIGVAEDYSQRCNYCDRYIHYDYMSDHDECIDCFLERDSKRKKPSKAYLARIS